MAEKIQTKIFNRGNKNEASWPSQYGSREPGLYYWDSDTQTFKKGCPPRKHKKYADAPTIIDDTIEKYYHPAAEKWTDSRAGLRDLDNATGCITTDKHIPPDPTWQNEQRRKRHADVKIARAKAVAAIDAGTAPLTEELRAKCERSNEIVSKALNFDAFNVAGKKNNEKGKRYRRR